MPRSQRYTMSQQSQPSNVLVEQMMNKENQYREGISVNHNLAIQLAERLKHGGELENMLGDFDEHRARLKKIAEINVQQGRQITAFIQALEHVKHDEEIEDYDAALKASMTNESQKIAESAVEIHQEKMYLDICSRMGEGPAARENGDDDDLEVMADESTRNLKCPISFALMVEPMRNKVCGHTYSKLSILDHLTKSKECPVTGCRNVNVARSQLEPDLEMATAIRRWKIRQEHAQRQISQNAIDMDDYDI